MNRQTPPHRFLIDPGWLFLAAGVATLAATVLIPATEDLRRARWHRDRALLVEKHRDERLARYEEFLAAVQSQDPTLILSLAERQLNQIPADRGALVTSNARLTDDVSVFPSLEPPPLTLPEFTPTESLLAKWTTADSTRVWMLLGGAVCVLVGLFPASRGWAARGHANTPL